VEVAGEVYLVVYSTYLTVEVVEEQEELEGSIKVAWVMKGECLEGDFLERDKEEELEVVVEEGDYLEDFLEGDKEEELEVVVEEEDYLEDFLEGDKEEELEVVVEEGDYLEDYLVHSNPALEKIEIQIA
jgi:hypothetical protein